MGQVTISGTNFDVYGTRAAADTYMIARIGSSWTASSSTDRNRALVSATRQLDRQNWTGERVAVAPGQPLEFPRTGLVDKDGIAVSSASVPLIMEEANYELALELLADPAVQEAGSTGSNTKKVKAGSTSVEFFRPTSGTKFPTIIQELVGLWLESADPADTGNVAFGTDGCSTFEDIDNWGLDKGFP